MRSQDIEESRKRLEKWPPPHGMRVGEVSACCSLGLILQGLQVPLSLQSSLLSSSVSKQVCPCWASIQLLMVLGIW